MLEGSFLFKKLSLYDVLRWADLCRGVGCIFFEMASGRPLFAGSAVDEQLHLIVKLLGTPNELTWPGVSQLHEFLAYEFPRYRPEPLVKHVPRLVMQCAVFY